ncbi:MAG: hypothetical protein BroJett015_09770 [Chloroflexota bacterium]|nr:MAG: hypothetical protein BroJett015_09770 [Chloroflexota bacterium]
MRQQPQAHLRQFWAAYQIKKLHDQQMDGFSEAGGVGNGRAPSLPDAPHPHRKVTDEVLRPQPEANGAFAPPG